MKKFSIRSVLTIFVISSLCFALCLQRTERWKIEKDFTLLKSQTGFVSCDAADQVYLRQLAENFDNHWTFRIRIPDGEAYVFRKTVDFGSQKIVHTPYPYTGHFELSINVTDHFEGLFAEESVEIDISGRLGLPMARFAAIRFPRESFQSGFGIGEIYNEAGYPDLIRGHSNVEVFPIGDSITLFEIVSSREFEPNSDVVRLVKLELIHLPKRISK